MEDEINHILSRAESKFCAPNGGVCTSKTVGLLVRRHIVAGQFHFIGKEASTRWAGGVDLSMMPEAGALDPADETCREYERVVDPKYLDQIRMEANEFSNKRLSRQSGVARSAIMNFKNGRSTGVVTLFGYGTSVRVDRGHLVVEDGIANDRRQARFPRVGHGLRRLVVIGSDGMVSFAALRWLADQDASFVMLDRDGSVLATTGPVRSSDSKLRRFSKSFNLQRCRFADRSGSDQQEAFWTRASRTPQASRLFDCRHHCTLQARTAAS
jgi:hypothetical protein